MQEVLERPARLAARDVLWMASPDLSETLYVSPTFEAVWGLPLPTPGEHMAAFRGALHGDDRERVVRAMREAGANGGELDHEYRIVRPDGQIRWIHDRAFAVRDAATGRAQRVVGVAEDVTDLKRQAEELEAARRRMVHHERLSALGSLISGLAHEIRTPLAAASNHLNLMRSRLNRASPLPTPLADVPGHVAATLDQVERIDRLVQGLRRFTRIEPTHRERQALDVAVAEAVLLFQSAHRGSVEVACELMPTTPVDLDKVQIEQVILRLLENAADATGRGGTVRVTTRETPLAVELTVEDKGHGIPSDVLPHIYDEFFTTKAGRTGLGLSIARRIVEAHGGAILCRSEVDLGAAFVVSLPKPR